MKDGRVFNKDNSTLTHTLDKPAPTNFIRYIRAYHPLPHSSLLQNSSLVTCPYRRSAGTSLLFTSFIKKLPRREAALSKLINQWCRFGEILYQFESIQYGSILHEVYRCVRRYEHRSSHAVLG
jgi:hypothetical protein